MIRQWWLGGVVVCLLATGLLARQGTIKTRDGRTLQGDIDETSPDGQSVGISIHGATITLPREDIVSIDYLSDDDQDFQQKLSKLDPNDIAGRIDLGNQALRAGNYDEAIAAAKDAQRLDPHDPDAAILLDTVASEKALTAKQPAAAKSAAPVAATPTTEPSPVNPGPATYLSDEDIQVIRQAELRSADDVRIQFFNDVRKRFMATSGRLDPATYASESSTEQALDIFESGDASLVKDVKIESDPSVLLEYRERVQSRVLAGCAASGCHGGGAGGFYLYPDAEQVTAAYTNFYILRQTSRKMEGGDMFGSGPVTRSMIDRVHVASSLLLQFGLPRSVATIPHPAVAGFKPMFRDETDGSFVLISDWISSMKPMAPEYGIQFTIPMGKPATRPASDGSGNP